jgi:hypothetical protein
MIIVGFRVIWLKAGKTSEKLAGQSHVALLKGATASICKLSGEAAVPNVLFVRLTLRFMAAGYSTQFNQRAVGCDHQHGLIIAINITGTGEHVAIYISAHD